MEDSHKDCTGQDIDSQPVYQLTCRSAKINFPCYQTGWFYTEFQADKKHDSTEMEAIYKKVQDIFPAWQAAHKNPAVFFRIGIYGQYTDVEQHEQ